MRNVPFHRSVVLLLALAILFTISIAFSQTSNRPVKPIEDKGKTKTFSYKILSHCFDASQSPKPGFVPGSAVQDLEKRLDDVGKAGLEVIAVERLPNLIAKNNQGTPVPRTECYMFLLKQSAGN